MVLGDRDTKLVRLYGPDYDAEPGGWSSKIERRSPRHAKVLGT